MSGMGFRTARCSLSGSGSFPRRSCHPGTTSSTHFFFGRPGERLVLFDNERGKGDHKHIRNVESPYHFESIEKLTADFMAALGAVQAEEGE